MNLQEFFQNHPRAALAFSGGVDSAYLLYAGLHFGCDLHPYYVKSAFQPQFEVEDALRLAKALQVKLTIIEADVLSVPTIIQNPADRCYYCKNLIFSSIIKTAKEDGYEILLDGTNASDDAGDRPGMRALKELSVLSPLRECCITKTEVRRLSKEAGLFTWDKPAYACLATRISTGEEITKEKLSITETSESFLSNLGFSDFRIRMTGRDAKIQVRTDQFEMLFLYREKILEKLRPYYHSITVDLEGRL